MSSDADPSSVPRSLVHVYRLTREEARRICVQAQLLTAERPTDLLSLVDHLTLLPVDLTGAVAPSADLVAWSRLGPAYRPEDLRTALEERALFEHNAVVRPMADLPLLRAEMEAWPPWEQTRKWLEANELFRAEVLDTLDSHGPLLSREVHATPQVPWRSSGWNEGRSVALMLECLMMRGEVAVDGRRGSQRLWNLAERVYPAKVETVPGPEARAVRDRRRLRALGLARARGTEIPGESVHVGDAGEPAVVEGVAGEWRVDPSYLPCATGDVAGRAALLSPFDALVRDRKRLAEVFEFDYVLEMYKPRAKRRWGYFALPVLHGDRLVGKLDATADRRAGQLFVDAVHEDGPWTRAVRAEVDAEIEALAGWLGLVPTRQAGAREGR